MRHCEEAIKRDHHQERVYRTRPKVAQMLEVSERVFKNDKHDKTRE